MMYDRAALIDQIEGKRNLERLVSRLLQSMPVELERFASHLYQARREYRRTCETAGKSRKQIERCVIASFQIAENYGSAHWGSLGKLGRSDGSVL